MSSDHDHHENDGAHEVDQMPGGRLFNLMIGLSALTLLSCIGVIQIFNMQVRWVQADYSAYEDEQRYSALREYNAEAEAVAAGYGEFDFAVGDGEETRYFVPVSTAKKAVLENAKLLDGTAKYKEWDNTPAGKTIKDWGGMPKPKPPAKKEPEKRPGAEPGKKPPAKAPAGKDPNAKPDEGKPGEGKPGKGKPGEGKPGEGKPGEGKPAGEKPGKDKPAGEKPGKGKPSRDKPAKGKPDTKDGG